MVVNIQIVAFLIVSLIFVDVKGKCAGDVGKCNWSPWKSWSGCSLTCGGGTRHRERQYCCDSRYAYDVVVCLDKCGHDMNYYYSHRKETQSCNTWCFNGGYMNSYNNCICSDTVYGICCEKHCDEIDNCKRRQCTSSWDNKCLECNDDKIFFKKTHYDTKCERLCAWNNHYCWPGSCGQELTRECTCAQGFKLIQQNGETSCQPKTKPSILTCNTVVLGPNMEKKQAKSSTNSTACQYLQDMYGNFQPTSFKFDMTAEYTINIAGYTKPGFISESNFGITDFATNLVGISIDGRRSEGSVNHHLMDNKSSQNCVRTLHDSNSMSVNSSLYSLRDGQALCLRFHVDAGGYLKSKNRVTHDIFDAVPYQKVHSTREICYRFDNSSAKHCLENGNCTYDPIQLANRVTRATHIEVDFYGWYDPVPSHGNSIQSSSIESYQITVNEVMTSMHNLTVNYLSNVFTQRVDFNQNRISFNLTTGKPRLYCVTLEVKDVADNVKQARRFILYDNSSFIETWKDKPFRFTSASKQTNYKWQTHHHSICLNWTDHFLNRFYFDNHLLNPILPEPHGLVSGVYEQKDGILPVSGTPNVYGIVKTMVYWSINGGFPSADIQVPNFQKQSYCKDFKVKDGQTYTLFIRSIDIANNTFIENRTVHIDRSVPHINNIWLIKDGYEVLFVHHTTDLPKMQLHFEALDPHSGVRQIEWTFGNTMAELSSGSLSVGSLNEKICPENSVKCYCPDVGHCEFYNYTVPLDKLVSINKHVGNHNRDYYFTLKVTNKAHLVNIERVDILVDDSPPEVGVIYEGPINSKDIDYTSDSSFIVHWHGFIDHESGIKEYRLGLASRCLSNKELYDSKTIPTMEYYTRVANTESSVRIPANFTGKRFLSIIALNNAMDPSDSVCSDGITRDLTPPFVRNLTLEHASWSETIVCHEGRAWLLHSSLSKIKLHNVSNCNDLCTNQLLQHPVASTLPTRNMEENDSDISQFLCRSLSKYMNSSIIYLPTDHINLDWDIEEHGSQIDDVLVGIGIDPSEVNSPSINAYMSTSKHNSFKFVHEGIGSDKLFVVFLKVVNKAGQERVSILGPILVDETPPICKVVPKVVIEKDDIIVGWENDTFYDIEQKEKISSIYFEIAHDNIIVTPLFQWNLETSFLCSGYSGGCFRYSIYSLQKHDNDLGLSFYINMHVYNNAGHFITVSTDTFKIPSTYPPGHGIVLDGDPDHESHKYDTNIHFTAHTLCLRWYGFKHHESVEFQVGIGSNNSTANVVPYLTLNHSTSYHCIHSSRIEFEQTYFALVKATCTGGVTVSLSNGIVVLNKTKLLDSLVVNFGEKCSTARLIRSNHTISTADNTSVTFPAGIGKRYKFFVFQGSISSVFTNDGIIEKDAERNNTLYFVPFVAYPSISLGSFTGATNQTAQLLIYKCPCSKHMIKGSVSGHWHYDNHVRYGLTFQIAILRMKNITDNITFVPFKQYQLVSNRYTHTFFNIDLELNKYYKLAIKQCSNVTCLDPVLSEAFKVNVSPEPGKILMSRLMKEVSVSCTQINLQWEAFQSDNSLLFYQWAVSADNARKRILTGWQTMKANDTRLYRVNSCIDLPVHLHSTMFTCIRAFNKAETETFICQRIEYVTDKPYMMSVVYDFDSNSESWKKILDVLPSSNVGGHYTFLHDNELDFGTLGTAVVGAMLYASERNITWFLMTDNYVPKLCKLSKDCIVSKVTNSGFVSFESQLTKLNTFYYICAYSNTTSVEREMYTEILDEIKTCSNGFVLDSHAPVTGKVEIRNNNGFLTSLDGITLSWIGFKDNINATKLGYVSDIQLYSYGIGSRPYVDDIRRFKHVGSSTRDVIDSLNVTDGSVIYVTVKATDHAGNTASTFSDEVIVDTSPPLRGQLEISTTGQTHGEHVFLSNDKITLHLSDFEEDESGIDHYEIGIGTQPFLTDVLSARVYNDSNILIIMQDISIMDGHNYHIAAKAVNRAGLSSEFATLRTIADKTPPNGGHVFEGLLRNKGNWYRPKGQVHVLKFKNQVLKDEDYQTDLTEINVHWKGFSDPHSRIAFYRAALGTRPFSENIEPFVYVGLLEYTTWHREFSIGKKYFTTVEACNGAGLCITRSSDGVVLDTSPPLQGSVQIGSDELHKKYQSHTSSVHVTWAGFEDPESGIDHYEMCIGTSPGKCDILQRINCLLQSNIIKTGLNLPSRTPLFATVTAFNKLHLNVTKSSDSFYVDETYPVVSIKPYFVKQKSYSRKTVGQWDRSVLQIQWKFDDEESPIVQHYVSLITHHEGHTPVENIQLGAENNITISLDGKSWLHNGDRYFITVTSCNLAGLCTSENSNDLIIDSTPPHLGGFKQPMYWENNNGSITAWKSNITLSWYGFHDQESGIERYFITISNTYSGDDLTNGVATVKVNSSESEIKHSFLVTRALNRDDKLYLTIWAENSVGLNSSLARVSVSVLSSFKAIDVSNQKGTLELEKHSCDVQYCNKDCTCAVVGKPCVEVQTNSTCREVNTSFPDQEYSKVEVFNGLDEKSSNITTSSACLTGSWTVVDGKINTRNISRFEWSIGLQNQPVGEGVFDLKNENPWNDVGLQTKAVHCLPVNKTLIARENYVIYVRAWLSIDSYVTFYSAPIVVDHTPPSLVRGRTILDSNELCSKDLDVIDWMDTITACWNRVFSEQQGEIIKFFLSMGTYPSGDDVIHRRDVGLNSSITFTHLSLSHGTKYFFAITAYNSVGLHTTALSDGFVVDMDIPVSGVVYNTLHQRDAAYQSSTATIGLSWHGFHDSVSGIRNYHAAISDVPNVNKGTNFINTGLRTNNVFRNLKLKEGKMYYGIVTSEDNVGHVSTISVSNGITIDSTPPVGYICQKYTDIKHLSNVSCVNDNVVNLHFNASLGTLYKITGYMSSDKFKKAKLLFHMDTFHAWLPLFQDHNQTYFFEQTFSSITDGLQRILIENQNQDQSDVTINVTLLECTQEIENSQEAITLKQISRSLVAVQMLVTDKESSISKIQLGAGTSPEGFQIKSLSRVHHHNHNHLIHTEALHATKVYATAIVNNKAGLRTVFKSQPITIDHTAPVIENLSRSQLIGQENVSGVIETQTTVRASWSVVDDESGVKICYCSIGHWPLLRDISPHWIAQTNTSCESTGLNLSHGQKLYINLKCFNNVGLSSEVVAEPLFVSIEPPSSNNAVISFVPQNKEVDGHMPRIGNTLPIQSNYTCLEFKWGGFVDLSGITHYEYRVYQSERTVEWVKTEKDMTKLLNVDVTGGEIIAEVRAINTGLLTSDSVNASLFIARFPPRLTGLAMQVTKHNEKHHLNWADVFDTITGVPFIFSLNVGTRKGYTDILDIEYISVGEIDVSVPESTIITPEVKEIFVTIDCIYVTGLRATYATSYKLL